MRGLSDRLQNLLMVSVEDYIRCAVPIASGTVAKRSEIGKSSATIRNDLKTLEEMGYLRQVHTSGGRIPTTMGYRAYVNKVLGEMNIKQGELSFAVESVTTRVENLPNIIEELTKKIADTFNFPVVVKTKFDQLQVAEIMIVPLVEGNTMVLIKTNAGSINSTVVTDIPLTDSQADDASAALNSRVRGLTLKEMFMGLPKIAAELKKDLSCFETLCKGIGSQLEKFIKNNISRKLDTIKLLEIPDYNNIEKIRKISIAVNDDEAINKALESDDSVVIGAEVDDGILGDSSIVKFNYKVCGENIASIGLIGPERIDYKNLIIALYALLGQVKERRLITGGASPGDVKRKHDKTG